MVTQRASKLQDLGSAELLVLGYMFILLIHKSLTVSQCSYFFFCFHYIYFSLNIIHTKLLCMVQKRLLRVRCYRTHLILYGPESSVMHALQRTRLHIWGRENRSSSLIGHDRAGVMHLFSLFSDYQCCQPHPWWKGVLEARFLSWSSISYHV
jgi:hypothetical protein